MSEDKSGYFREVLGKGHCYTHGRQNIVVNDGEECPQCMIEKITSTQPSPPTPRPDVEGIKKENAELNVALPDVKTEFNTFAKIIALCDSYLELEKERDALKSIEVGASFAKQDQLDKADSLLADLVEAVKKRRIKEAQNQMIHTIQCINNGGFNPRECICGYDDETAALTAAKEYFEKGKKE